MKLFIAFSVTICACIFLMLSSTLRLINQLFNFWLLLICLTVVRDDDFLFVLYFYKTLSV
ncbi:hypothetical protein Hanom_Chr08g00736431 [Helianthus anomalus]